MYESELQRVPQAKAQAVPQGLDARLHGRGRVEHDRLGDLGGPGDEPGGGHDLGHEADLVGPASVYDLVGPHQRHANHVIVRHAFGQAHCGVDHGAERHVIIEEGRILRAYDNIRLGYLLQAGRGANTVDCGNHGLEHVVSLGTHRGVGAVAEWSARRRGLLLQQSRQGLGVTAALEEGVARASQNDDLHVPVVPHILPYLYELAHHPGA